MSSQVEFEELRLENASWWHKGRGKLLRETIAQALRGKSQARVLDFGCAAELQPDPGAFIRVVNAHSSLEVLAFQQMEGAQGLVCSRAEELGFASNSFDVIVAWDVLQCFPDDLVGLREMRRVLKDGGLLCVTVPAYSFFWSEDDEQRRHERRYTGSELRRKLASCGFEIHRASYFVASGFLPLLTATVVKSIFKKSLGRHRHFAKRSPIANSAMIALLDFERHLMHLINLPFGTRVVCWARKPALVTERVTVPAWERHWAAPPLPQGTTFSGPPELPSAS